MDIRVDPVQDSLYLWVQLYWWPLQQSDQTADHVAEYDHSHASNADLLEVQVSPPTPLSSLDEDVTQHTHQGNAEALAV